MITLGEQIAEAQRELALRRQCYPARVKSGKLDAGDAYYQLQTMEAIVRSLQRLDVEQRQLSLFGTGGGGGAGAVSGSWGCSSTSRPHEPWHHEERPHTGGCPSSQPE